MFRYRFLRFPGGKLKAVTFSYDDGHICDLRLAKRLDAYGIKCTFNINSSKIGDRRRMTAEEIQTHILDQGHEVAIHGHLHRAPGLTRPVEAIGEFLDCRRDLEKTFGRIIRGMAYPDSGIRFYHNGASYEDIRRYLKDLDILYSRTLGGDNNGFELPLDWYAWMPTAHHKNPLIFDYIEEFNAIDEADIRAAKQRPRPKLFYLWGHSFEFEQEEKFNSWDHLEKICRAISRKEDTWYATNMEIYEYIKAYESLIFSADGKQVYNPTLQTIWFDVDGTPYTIGSGETVFIET